MTKIIYYIAHASIERMDCFFGAVIAKEEIIVSVLKNSEGIKNITQKIFQNLIVVSSKQ